MRELINIIEKLTADNLFIANFVEKNMESVKSEDIDTLDALTKEFYSFLNNYSIRNEHFKTLMKEHNYNKVDEITNVDGLDKDDLNRILDDFKSSVKNSQEKLSIYAKLVSGELNMINKIKHFKQSGKVDIKL